jgi:hypothetical protein
MQALFLNSIKKAFSEIDAAQVLLCLYRAPALFPAVAYALIQMVVIANKL